MVMAGWELPRASSQPSRSAPPGSVLSADASVTPRGTLRPAMLPSGYADRNYDGSQGGLYQAGANQVPGLGEVDPVVRPDGHVAALDLADPYEDGLRGAAPRRPRRCRSHVPTGTLPRR
jgi:hypothetical protein